ncbi:MAG: prolyl oligopeptidase family serine peptidase, partial [Bacteroidales bacterium]
AGAAVSNMTSAYGAIRNESGRARLFQYEEGQSRIGGSMWDEGALPLYLGNSPLFLADIVNTPLLMMHNDNDGAVPWSQSVEYYLALRRLGKPAWLLVYNNEAHNLGKWPNRVDLSIRMKHFFDHYLKDAPAPVWMTRGRPALIKDYDDAYSTE